MDDLAQAARRRRKELDLARAGLEIPSAELQKVEKQGKLQSIIVKGLFLVVAVALMPLLHKQSPQLMPTYANHATIARSWELINLLVIGLAVSYGFISRRHSPSENDRDTDTDTAVAAQGVGKIFDFAEVFENVCLPGDEKVEAWSSRWHPQESLVVIGNVSDDKEKPLLLPIRSLKSSLSNPEVFDILNDASAPAVEESGKTPEVRNATILSVESCNFDEALRNEEEPTVFPSPIPWASRLDVLNNQEAHPLVPTMVNLASADGKVDPPAIPSPIPWRSRPEQNGDISDTMSKPPLPHPQRPPPPPPDMPNKSVSPSPSPRPSPSPPRPRPSHLGSANANSHSGIPLHKNPSPSPPHPLPVEVTNDNSKKNLQPSSEIPLHKYPSPSPPRPPPVELRNDNSKKNLQPSSEIPLHKFPSPRPSPSPPRPQSAFPENGSSPKYPNPKPQYNNEAAQAQRNNSIKDPTPSPPQNGSSQKHPTNGNSPIPKSPQSTPVPPPVLQEFSQPKERLGSAPGHTTNSRSKSGNERSDLRGKGRECSSSRSNSRSKSRESSSDLSTNGRESGAGESTKLPSLPQTLYPDESTPISAPLPPPPPYSDEELSNEKTSSSSDVLYEMEDSISESEEEVDKKADQFIAKFHEQIRLQRVESMRRHDRTDDQ